MYSPVLSGGLCQLWGIGARTSSRGCGGGISYLVTRLWGRDLIFNLLWEEGNSYLISFGGWSAYSTIRRRPPMARLPPVPQTCTCGACWPRATQHSTPVAPGPGNTQHWLPPGRPEARSTSWKGLPSGADGMSEHCKGGGFCQKYEHCHIEGSDRSDINSEVSGDAAHSASDTFRTGPGGLLNCSGQFNSRLEWRLG